MKTVRRLKNSLLVICLTLTALLLFFLFFLKVTKQKQPEDLHAQNQKDTAILKGINWLVEQKNISPADEILYLGYIKKVTTNKKLAVKLGKIIKETQRKISDS